MLLVCYAYSCHDLSPESALALVTCRLAACFWYSLDISLATPEGYGTTGLVGLFNVIYCLVLHGALVHDFACSGVEAGWGLLVIHCWTGAAPTCRLHSG